MKNIVTDGQEAQSKIFELQERNADNIENDIETNDTSEY